MGYIYGVNPVLEAVNSGKTINKIYVQKGNKEACEVMKKANEKKIVTVFAEKNVMTEYEAKFSEKGQVIYRVEAQFQDEMSKMSI